MDVPTIAKINELREDLYGLRKEVLELKKMTEELLTLASKKGEVTFPPFSGVAKKETENAGARTEEDHKENSLRKNSEKKAEGRKSET